RTSTGCICSAPHLVPYRRRLSCHSTDRLYPDRPDDVFLRCLDVPQRTEVGDGPTVCAKVFLKRLAGMAEAKVIRAGDDARCRARFAFCRRPAISAHLRRSRSCSVGSWSPRGTAPIPRCTELPRTGGPSPHHASDVEVVECRRT